MGQKLHNFGFENDFLGMISKVHETKEKNRQIGCHEDSKNLCIKNINSCPEFNLKHQKTKTKSAQ
jgi:hypothetical protein